MKSKALKYIKKLEKIIAFPITIRKQMPYKCNVLERLRLRNLPRRKNTTTNVGDFTVEILDPASFLSSYRSIFEKEVYKFNSNIREPRIIDGGANIGLATLYWKSLFESARITAFEPDPLSFGKLKCNLNKNNINNVNIVQKGLWKNERKIDFRTDGADGSHLSQFPAENEVNRSSVDVTTLDGYIDGRVDMLKLDIEGAEYEVLKSISSKLSKVHNIFIEYHSYPGREQNIGSILEILKSSGFRLHLISEISSDCPFIHRKTYNGKDNTVNIFAYRE